MSRDTWWAILAAGATVALTRAAIRASRQLDPAGRTVLITGGSRGLGINLARQFAGRGARVAVCARNTRELDRACDSFAGMGRDFVALPCDVTRRDQVDAMVQKVHRQLGPIDFLVNNAGVIQVGPLETMTLQDFEEAMAVHFWGPLYTTLAVLPTMRQRRVGRIVNISSIGGKVPIPHLAPYVASKFALTGFSETLRSELAKDNVLVTTVCPGLMRTGSPRNAFFKGQHQAEYAWFVLGDSLPGASMAAGRAARKIVEAAIHGDAELVLSFPAKAAVWFHGLFPGTTAEILRGTNRLLPAAGGIGTARAQGKESETPLTRSAFTTLTQRAAVANNEML